MEPGSKYWEIEFQFLVVGGDTKKTGGFCKGPEIVVLCLTMYSDQDKLITTLSFCALFGRVKSFPHGPSGSGPEPPPPPSPKETNLLVCTLEPVIKCGRNWAPLGTWPYLNHNLDPLA